MSSRDPALLTEDPGHRYPRRVTETGVGSSLFGAEDRKLARAVSRLMVCNPFLPERVEREQEVLGSSYVDEGPVWSSRGPVTDPSPNVRRLGVVVEGLATRGRRAWTGGHRPSADDRRLYEDVIMYLLFHRYQDAFNRLIAASAEGTQPSRRADFFRSFARDADRFLSVPGSRAPRPDEVAHLFACGLHICRAFHEIFTNIVGGSLPIARLRARVWESIFSQDMHRYRRSLYCRMGDFTTLILGPSGTGKELVALAIARSRYIPFDAGSASFSHDVTGTFVGLNLSAMSPTLIESELFGHKKGAFTGALQDKAGWLEECPALGTVFLDEIGELDPAIQVKLLRVLQTRVFERLGDTRHRRFQGKIIAATNRDLAAEMESGHFREDFYFRLCSDVIVTPPLREQLAAEPKELRLLVEFVARSIVGEDEAEGVADQVEAFIRSDLGADYPWEGNFRELEQCVRNIVIRGEYRPQGRRRKDELAEALRRGSLTAEELVARYCSQVYEETGSYLETSRRIGLDRRTVKSKVEAWRKGQQNGE